MPVYKQWVLKNNSCKGMPTEEDFQMNEEHTPDLRKGEILCRALFLSVDPITRLYMSYGMENGDIIPGRQVGRVVESRHRDFPKGKLVCGTMGWQTYSVVSPDATQEMCGRQIPLVEALARNLEYSGLPKSSCLGVLGVPGLSAYIGLLHVCKATAGETVVISSAAGQMGHVVGQIAKLQGCHVIGYTGDAEKASWIKTELGFDWAFNYKTQDVRQTLKIAAPQGVDIFIDSVGGIFHSTVLDHMTLKGRVLIFGTLALYNNPKNIPMVHANDLAISLKELSIFGFNVNRYMDLFDKSAEQLTEWVKNGDIQAYEHVVEGFENMPKAFIEQLEGKSQGKVIVRV